MTDYAESLIESEFQAFLGPMQSVMTPDMEKVLRRAFHAGGLSVFMAVDALFTDEAQDDQAVWDRMKLRKQEYLAFEQARRDGAA